MSLANDCGMDVSLVPFRPRHPPPLQGGSEGDGVRFQGQEGNFGFWILDWGLGISRKDAEIAKGSGFDCGFWIGEGILDFGLWILD